MNVQRTGLLFFAVLCMLLKAAKLSFSLTSQKFSCLLVAFPNYSFFPYLSNARGGKRRSLKSSQFPPQTIIDNPRIWRAAPLTAKTVGVEKGIHPCGTAG